MSNTENDDKKHLSPLEQVIGARELWLFTFYICYGLRSGKISSNIFPETLKLKTGEDTDYIINKPKWNSRNIEALGHNLNVSIMGVCFCALNSVLKDAFGNIPKHYTNSDIDALRAIVYMFRCAFSHQPTNPRWKINKRYIRVFRIDEIDVEMDFTQLDGKTIIPSQHNGWRGIFSIINYCFKVIEESNSHGINQEL